jgi:hypothetical protein
VNLCRSCGEDFASVEAFDAHRIGTYAYTFAAGWELDPPREDGRRCLGTEELAGSGWTLDTRSRWVHPREVRKRVRKGGDSLPGATASPNAGVVPSSAPQVVLARITALPVRAQRNPRLKAARDHGRSSDS